MKLDEIFPVRIYAQELEYSVFTPELAQSVWMRQRPTGMIWYCADFEIITPTSIRLFVYDMRDNFHGGIGDCIHEVEVDKFTPAEEAMLARHVMKVYTDRAAEELRRREDEEYIRKVELVRKEMFGV